MNKIDDETQMQLSNIQGAYHALAEVIRGYAKTAPNRHQNHVEAKRKYAVALQQLEVSMLFVIDGLCLAGEERDSVDSIVLSS